uniref:von Willebrand factor A domain-containing protein 1 n=1 Tax=Callorhinchus milii TaxID=7868 RepID=V9KHB5_CALMI
MLALNAVYLSSYLLQITSTFYQVIALEGVDLIGDGVEGDLLFLMDSSGSISPYEFMRMKNFVADLVRPLPIGPHDIQIGFVHISDDPVVEFPFDEYTSDSALQWALLNMKQKLGDTNSGKALSHAADTMFTHQAGSRPDLPKVVLWLTDGISTDDISGPIQQLNDLGVTRFIVSIGRGNYLELKNAASQPPDKHLYYVDSDDMFVITEELRYEILNLMRVKKLRALDVTDTSFRLLWPKLLGSSSEYYLIEYNPAPDSQRILRKLVAGDETSAVLTQLSPETTYEVRLTPMNDENNIKPLVTKVTTREGEDSPVSIVISESSSEGFRVSWAPTPESIASYLVVFGVLPSGQPSSLHVDGRENTVVLNKLEPSTTYLVTVSALYKSGREKALSAKACTRELSDSGSVSQLWPYEITPDSVVATWDPTHGRVLNYQVTCPPQAGRRPPEAAQRPARSVQLTDPVVVNATQNCVEAKSEKGSGHCRKSGNQFGSLPATRSNKSLCTKGRDC